MLEHHRDLLAILDAGPLPHTFMTVQQRQALDDGLDALIAYLDAVEPDPDLEDGGDLELTGDETEPSLGAPERHEWWQSQRKWADGGQQDLEEVCEDEGACIQSQPHDEETDKEPALGVPEGLINQRQWGGSATTVSEESEPTLGAPENSHDQRRWWQGRKGSVELDHDERTGLSDGRWQHREALRAVGRETETELRHKLRMPDRGSNLVFLGRIDPRWAHLPRCS